MTHESGAESPVDSGAAPAASAVAGSEETSVAPPMRLGFARGIAPSKWERRWLEAVGRPLELHPIEVAFGRSPAAGRRGSGARSEVDVMLERAHPGERPDGSSGDAKSRHAIRLYTEAIALVVPIDHELAESGGVEISDLALVRLLDHPDHAPDWPAAAPWDDPSWRPADAYAALDLVATGAGGILLPRPLARHLARKREHAVIPLLGEPLPGTTVWASWAVDRDAPDVQQLAGILRGRTARSSRPAAQAPAAAPAQAKPARAQQPAAKKPQLKPNSRGAQLAAAREKAEREKAARRRAKRR